MEVTEVEPKFKIKLYKSLEPLPFGQLIFLLCSSPTTSKIHFIKIQHYLNLKKLSPYGKAIQNLASVYNNLFSIIIKSRQLSTKGFNILMSILILVKIDGDKLKKTSFLSSSWLFLLLFPFKKTTTPKQSKRKQKQKKTKD